VHHRKQEIILKHSSGTARIFMESNGYPHIHADSRTVGAYAIGHLHAMDRLWQMDYLRRFAQGRLSEVIGSLTLKVDEAMRVLQMRKT
jgi:penicillin amidase